MINFDPARGYLAPAFELQLGPILGPLSVPPMLKYIVKRLLALIPVLFGLSLIVFLIMALIPGDPALAILGSYATPEGLAKLAHRNGARSQFANAISRSG